ncbi:hypothetical protein ACOBQX_18335 [Actinokineospora sp. G85]
MGGDGMVGAVSSGSRRSTLGGATGSDVAVEAVVRAAVTSVA